MDTPAVSGLHPRSVTVTWFPPSQPNGIITNYTLHLSPNTLSSLDFKPSSVYNSSTTFNSSSSPDKHLMPSTYHDMSYTLRLTSSPPTPDSRHILTSNVTTSSDDSSSTNQSTHPNLLTDSTSVLEPEILEDNQVDSTGVSNTSQGPGFISFPSTNSNATSLNADLSPVESNTENSTTKTKQLHEQDSSFSHTFVLTSKDSYSTSSTQSVSVPGNITSYTFPNLLPYQSYSLKVQFGITVLW